MRFGLVGCGDIGALRAEALGKSPAHKLTLAFDLDTARLDGLAATCGVAKAPSFGAMLAADDVDAIIISTPPNSHAELTVAALAAGKHVLCEKPLARDSAEAEKMIAVAEKSGCFLATGFNYRFYPSMLRARELLDSGIIGRLDHIRSYTGYSADDHDKPWLHDVAVMGGGALRDNGVHLIDLTTYFLGDVAEIKGFTSNSVWGFPGCEDNGFALLKSPSGQIASIQASWTEWRGYKLLVELYGERGCIRAWCFPMMVQTVSAAERGGRTRTKWELFPKVQILEKLRSYRWVVVESFIKEFDAFAEAASGQTSAVATGRDGLLAMEIACQAAASV